MKKKGIIISFVLSALVLFLTINFFQAKNHKRNIRFDANIAYEQGNTEDAIVGYENLLQSGEYELKTLDRLLEIYVSTKQLDRGKEFFVDLRHKYPKNGEVFSQLGYVFLYGGDYSKAEKVFKETLEKGYEWDGYEGLGYLFLKKGDYVKSEEFLLKCKPFRDQSLREGKRKYRIFRSIYRGAVYAKETGYVDQAFEIYEGLKNLKSNEERLYLDLGELYEYKKDKVSADYNYGLYLSMSSPIDAEKRKYVEQRQLEIKEGKFLNQPKPISA